MVEIIKKSKKERILAKKILNTWINFFDNTTLFPWVFSIVFAIFSHSFLMPDIAFEQNYYLGSNLSYDSIFKIFTLVMSAGFILIALSATRKLNVFIPVILSLTCLFFIISLDVLHAYFPDQKNNLSLFTTTLWFTGLAASSLYYLKLIPLNVHTPLISKYTTASIIAATLFFGLFLFTSTVVILYTSLLFLTLSLALTSIAMIFGTLQGLKASPSLFFGILGITIPCLVVFWQNIPVLTHIHAHNTNTLLLLHGLFLSFSFWVHNKNTEKHTTSLSISHHTAHERRVFTQNLRQKLEKPSYLLSTAEVFEYIVNAVDITLPNSPALILNRKVGFPWQIISLDNKIAHHFRKTLPSLEENLDTIALSTGETRIHLKDDSGTTYWIFPIESENDQHTLLVITPVSILDKKQQWQQSIALANHAKTLLSSHRKTEYWQQRASIDPLTEVLNRSTFLMEGQTQLTMNTNKNDLCCLLFIDIDNFKAINDEFGHIIGDFVLTETANIIKNNLRQQDLIGRYGGEEFVALLTNTNYWQASIIAKRIINAMGKHTPQHINMPVTVSIGLTSTTYGSQTLSQLIQKADKSMYKAKKLGKNQLFPDYNNSNMNQTLLLESQSENPA